MNETMNKVSMEIILYAGDAQYLITESLNAIELGAYELAIKNIEKASVEITKAHQAQTEIIQLEANSKKIEYSILFTHAQDTLMTVKMSLEMTKKLINIFKVFDKRIMEVKNEISNR